MDIPGLLSQLGIEFISSGNKHCTTGWVNTHCPFCSGSKNYHLGIPLQGKITKCWRCGSHPIYSTLAKLSHTPETQVKTLAKRYVGVKPHKSMDAAINIRRKAFKLPSDLNRLSIPHTRYLSKRNFHANTLIKLWGIVGSGPISKLGKIDYKWRILAPIFWEDKMVSFQARTISNVEPKYKACPKDRELIHHQHIVYAHQNCDWSKPVVVVEGITDVWRLGIQSVAVFGIDYLPQQVRAICRRKREAGDDRIIVMFDDDPQAILRGKELTSTLNFRGMDAIQEVIVGDPGDMDQGYADKLMESILEF